MKKLLLLLTTLLALRGGAAAQTPADSSVLRLWSHRDQPARAPGNGNPLLPGYYADPTIIEDRGTYYVYATSDLTDWNGISRMAAWTSTDFVHWQCQYLNWPTKAQCTSPTSQTAGVWAPSVVKAPNGKFYMYVSVGEEIWVGVADAPLGPWRNARPDGQPLIRYKSFYFVETIDAECFIDDDGQAYLYWGSLLLRLRHRGSLPGREAPARHDHLRRRVPRRDPAPLLRGALPAPAQRPVLLLLLLGPHLGQNLPGPLRHRPHAPSARGPRG